MRSCSSDSRRSRAVMDALWLLPPRSPARTPARIRVTPQACRSSATPVPPGRIGPAPRRPLCRAIQRRNAAPFGEPIPRGRPAMSGDRPRTCPRTRRPSLARNPARRAARADVDDERRPPAEAMSGDRPRTCRRDGRRTKANDIRRAKAFENSRSAVAENLWALSARRAPALLAGRPAGNRELVLGVPDALLELPAVGGRLARARRCSSSAFASSSCVRARSSSISLTSTASSTSASASIELDLEEARARSRTRRTSSAWPRWTRVEPALSVATSGAWRASTPISPAAPGTISMLGLALEHRRRRA